VTPRCQPSKVFLSLGGFPERGTGRPRAVAVAGLTSSLSEARCHYFHNGSSFRRGLAAARPRLLRKSCRPFAREARRLPRSIASAVRFVLDLLIGVTAARPRPCRGRSRTLTGQCHWPLCPGDSTKHSDGLHVVTKYRRQREDRPPGLPRAPELGPPSEPKRDASRTVFTWPLRRRSLPPDAGCVPWRTPGSSEDFRTSLDPLG
jgi:hypothetical protein